MFKIGEVVKKGNSFVTTEIIVMFWLIILSEWLTKYSFYYFEGFHRIGLVIKGLIYGYCLKVIFQNGNFFKDNKWLILFFLTSLIGALSLQKINFELRLANFIFSFIKYSFPIFIFQNFIKKSDLDSQRFLKHFAYAIILNTVLICLGMLFKIEVFRSYPFSDRFGYNGLFFRSWTASYIYLIAIISFIYSEGRVFKIALFLAIVFGLLIGTKLSFLGIALIFGHEFIIRGWYKHKVKVLALFTGVVLLVSCFKFWFNKLFKIIFDVYKQDGIVTAFFSYRDVSFENVILKYVNESWTFINYIFGSGDNCYIYSEIGIVDVYLMFGLLSVLFIYLYYFNIFGNMKLLFFVFFIGVFLSGNFFHNTTVTFSFFFALSCLGRSFSKNHSKLDL